MEIHLVRPEPGLCGPGEPESGDHMACPFKRKLTAVTRLTDSSSSGKYHQEELVILTVHELRTLNTQYYNTIIIYER